jgi:signal transduction histidine kinase
VIDFLEDYSKTLKHFIDAGDEEDLERAYELGRAAVEFNISVLEVALAHHNCLTELLIESPSQTDNARIARSASVLFKETLAPFEVTRLGYRDTITILRNQNTNLARLTEERAALVKQREEFIMVLAHDLKNPISGNARVLTVLLESGRYPIDGQLADILKIIKEANDDLLKMVKNLLEVFRLDQSQQVFSFGAVDIVRLLGDCLCELSKDIVSKGQKLVYEPVSDLPPVAADVTAIKHVFLNLIENAIKYTPQEKEIHIKISSDMESVSVQIIDSGVGMDEDELSGLFRRFSQGAAGRSQTHGSGLGLYLCKQILDAHKGRISCTSELNRGTSFRVELPLWIQESILGKNE